VTEYTVAEFQRGVLRRQAEMIMRAANETIPDHEDLADVQAAFDRLTTVADRLDSGATAPRSWFDADAEKLTRSPS
jgi:uncharacterized membrane protein